MELRPQLQPAHWDASLLERLADLAAKIDGARPGEWDDWVNEFNQLADTEIPYDHFQGIYGAEEHIDWVRRVLDHKQNSTTAVADVTRDELVEVMRRAMKHDDFRVRESYMAIFDANVPLPQASNLIFYPLDYDSKTNTWDRGRPLNEYDPTPEQIVDWAMATDTRESS